MNTSKQVNVMIGLLFLAFLAFGAYILNEPNRQAKAEEAQADLLAHRGASLFVNNCRTCHGLLGLGGEESAIAPKLNSIAYRIFEEGNPEGAPVTAEGEVRSIRDFLFNTIACGRVNTAMPVWSERYGGPLSETQINYLVDLITTGRWDLVEEVGHEHDIEQGVDPSEVVLPPTQAGSLSVTQSNCGQYQGATLQTFRNRDPFNPDAGGPTPTATPTDPNALTEVRGVLVGEFFTNNCAACHGQERQGLVGPALLPSTLTESDDFYRQTIHDGRTGTAMPAWGSGPTGFGLTDEEINNLVQFIKNVEP